MFNRVLKGGIAAVLAGTAMLACQIALNHDPHLE